MTGRSQLRLFACEKPIHSHTPATTVTFHGENFGMIHNPKKTTVVG